MKIGALLKLPIKAPKEDDRDSFIGNSLTSSTDLSDRILRWSGSNDRERLHVMRFHEEWRHPDCAVMKWYDLQDPSSTRFRIIEHRQNIQGPFFHEFLVLRLADGSACRVERVGNGSRADALRRIGCTANDMIQLFTSENYALFSESAPSRLVATINLGKDFDILDVLAVCYTVQHSKICRGYTLQRYNCYFLCLMILSVLTRRLGNWENVIGSEAWDRSVDASLNALLNLPPEAAKAHLILRVCASFDPGNAMPAEFIVNEFRTQLASERHSLGHFNDALGATLWHTSWKSALEVCLHNSLKDIKQDVLRHENACAEGLRSAFRDSKDMMRQKLPSYDMIEKVFSREFFMHLSLQMGRVTELISQERQMVEMECSSPFGTRSLSWLGGFLVGLVIGVYPGILGKEGNSIEIRNANTRTRMTLMKFMRMAGGMTFMSLFRDDDDYQDILDRYGLAFSDQAVPLALFTAIDKLEAKGTLVPLEVTALIHATTGYSSETGWFTSPVAEVLGKALVDLLQMHASSSFRVTYMRNEGESSEIEDVIQFQDNYILERMQAHADRVATHQLAAAPLVLRDLQETMSEVWKSIPPGFGPSLHTHTTA